MLIAHTNVNWHLQCSFRPDCDECFWIRSDALELLSLASKRLCRTPRNWNRRRVAISCRDTISTTSLHSLYNRINLFRIFFFLENMKTNVIQLERLIVFEWARAASEQFWTMLAVCCVKGRWISNATHLANEVDRGSISGVYMQNVMADANAFDQSVNSQQINSWLECKRTVLCSNRRLESVRTVSPVWLSMKQYQE